MTTSNGFGEKKYQKKEKLPSDIYFSPSSGKNAT